MAKRVTAVLKVHSKFDDKDPSWKSGTGWLIKDDLVVTAGHLVVDHERRKLARYLNAYAGYHGLGSIGDSDVQKRKGKRVVLPEAYCNNKRRVTCDVAIVKLRKPFDDAKPFEYRETPEQGQNEYLGVVGYPGDKGEDAPYMYKQFKKTSWNLGDAPLHLLQYEISTYGGKSICLC